MPKLEIFHIVMTIKSHVWILYQLSFQIVSV